MNIFELYFLPFIIFMGLVTSYEDIKYKKIRNIWILLSIVYSLTILFLVIISTQVINKSYISTFILNAIIAAAVGFAFWNFGLWSAGDGKLFIAYSTLVPLSVYEIGNIAYFSSYIILVNTFLPLLFFYLAKGVFKTNIRENLNVIKTINTKYIIKTSLFILALYSITHTIFYILNWQNFYSIVVSSLLILALLQNINNKLVYYGLFSVALLNLIMNFEKIVSLELFKSLIATIFLIVFIRFFVMGLAFNAFTENIKINRLKRGMYLAEKPPFKAPIENQNKLKFRIFLRKKIPFLFKSFELKEENIRKLKKFYLNEQLTRDYVKIYQKAPFAPAIFLGVLITIILRGNAFVFIRLLIESFI